MIVGLGLVESDLDEAGQYVHVAQRVGTAVAYFAALVSVCPSDVGPASQVIGEGRGLAKIRHGG